jgi:outer membrane protein assembly factor BamB
MDLTRGERWKLTALGAAIVVGAGVIVVKTVTDRPDEPEAPTSFVESSLRKPPVRSWTLDVTKLSDNTGEVLLGMPEPLDTYYGYPRILDAGDKIVVATGLPLPQTDPSSSGVPVGAVTLVGVNMEDGSSLWRTPVGHVDGCDQRLSSNILACWEVRRVVFVDTNDGTLLADIGTDFDLSGATVVDDVVYGSGYLDGTPMLTKGTTTDLTRDFRRTVESAPDSWVYPMPERGIAIESTRGNGDPQYIYTVYDLESGAEKFTYEGDSLLAIGDNLFLSSIGSVSGTVGTQNLLRADGSIIRAVTIPAYNAAGYPARASVPLPLFLGDGAYDPSTGEELWRNPRMVIGQFNGKESAVAAAVGKSVIVTDPDTRTISGLDIESGRQLWQTPWEDAYWIRDGLTDGEVFVFSDYKGTHAIDARDGKIVWSLPLGDGAVPGSTRVSTAGEAMYAYEGNAYTFFRGGN